LWGLKKKGAKTTKEDDEPSLTDSEEEDKEHAKGVSKDENVLTEIKLTDGSTLPAPEIPGFGDMIKKFWSKYIYNGFKDMYKMGRGAVSGDEHEELGNRMYEEYPDFQNEVDLMKDLNQSKELGPEPEFDLDMEIDGLERL